MNFKILLALMVIPLSVMAQNRTNEFDNVFIKRGLTFSGGTPGSGRVLTSDAVGNYTPQVIPASSGPFATTNAENFFLISSPNTFNAPTLTSNLTVRGDYVLGSTASHSGTFNGSTWTIANNPQVNTDVWRWPGAGGTITNGTSLYSQNTLFASNMITRSTDGIAYVTTVAGVSNLIETVNGSAGIKETRALYMFSTNTLTAALPVINTIYTNNSVRLNLSVTATFGANSSAYIWTATSGGITNEWGLFGTSVATTNSVFGLIQPNSFYMFSNGLGTVTLHPGRWNGARE